MSREIHPVIIASLGRAGSTLLVRALNCLDGVFLFGEHNGAFYNLRRLYEDSQYFKETQSENGLRILRREGLRDHFLAWASPFSSEELQVAIRAFLSDLYLSKLHGHEVCAWGFKEIRYKRKDLEFFRKIWPDLKVIFLLREADDQFASSFSAFTENGIGADYLPSFISEYLEFFLFAEEQVREGYPAHILWYEDLCRDWESQMGDLARFIGAQVTEKALQELREVFGTRIDFVHSRRAPEPKAMEALAAHVKALKSLTTRLSG